MVNILKATSLSWKRKSPASYLELQLTKGFPLVQLLSDFERSITVCQLTLKTAQITLNIESTHGFITQPVYLSVSQPINLC